MFSWLDRLTGKEARDLEQRARDTESATAGQLRALQAQLNGYIQREQRELDAATKPPEPPKPLTCPDCQGRGHMTVVQLWDPMPGGDRKVAGAIYRCPRCRHVWGHGPEGAFKVNAQADEQPAQKGRRREPASLVGDPDLKGLMQ